MDGQYQNVIGAEIEGKPGYYRPGPGDPGVVVGSVLGKAGDASPQFIKEASPDGEVWRRLEAPENSTKEKQNE